MGAKARCSNCKEYADKETMIRVGLGGLGGLCSDECFEDWLQKRRNKRERRKVHRERKYGGRRLPGTCRDRVRRRDHGNCRWCGTNQDLQIHHVRYRSEGGPDTPRNLLTLCAECHAKAHSNKKLYQPVLLTWLWLFYEQEREVTIDAAMRLAAANESWADDARVFSDLVFAENKAAALEGAA